LQLINMNSHIRFLAYFSSESSLVLFEKEKDLMNASTRTAISKEVWRAEGRKSEKSRKNENAINDGGERGEKAEQRLLQVHRYALVYRYPDNERAELIAAGILHSTLVRAQITKSRRN